MGWETWWPGRFAPIPDFMGYDAAVMPIAMNSMLMGAVGALVVGCADDEKVCRDGYGLAADDNCYPLAGLDDTGAPSAVIQSVEIGPDFVQTNDSVWSRVVLDGDRIDTGVPFEDYAVKYTWYVDGEESLGTAAHLHGWSYFEKGQLITLIVSNLDGTGASMPSNAITIQNTAPKAPDVQIEPSSPIAYNDDLQCVVEAAVDVDLDELTYEIIWTVDDEVWTAEGPPTMFMDDDGRDTSAPIETGPPPEPGVVPARYTAPGQRWTCTVTPFDGEVSGPAAEASIQIRDGFVGWDAHHMSLEVADYVFHGENPSDFAGASLSGAGDVDGDGYADLLVPAYFHDGVGENSGRIYLIRAVDVGDPGEYELGDMPYQFEGAMPDEEAGHSVSGGADVDGDGLDDLLFCGYRASDALDENGRVYLVYSGDLGSPGVRNLATADVTWIGEASEDRLGHAFFPAGDADGDGRVDLLVGAYGNDTAGVDAGKTYVIPGSSIVDFEGERTIGSNEYIFLGEEPGDESGHALRSALDVDGDGLSDFMVGARLSDFGATDGGKAYMISGGSLGSTEETVNLSDADHIFFGEVDRGWVGYAVTGAGDVDGDGRGDLLIGAHSSDEEQGRVYLVMASSLDAQVQSLETADVRFEGEYTSDQAGRTIAPAGDVDGDELADVLIGARNHWDRYGAAYLVLGESVGPGIFSLSGADYIFDGEERFDEAGYTVAGAGDFNRDGLDDVLVAAWQGSFDTATANPGKAYLLLAPGTEE